MQAGNWQVGARPTGVAMRTGMNENFNAEASMHKGPIPPAYAAGIAGFGWCDDSADPIWSYRHFKGGDVNDVVNWPVHSQINRITGQVLYTSSVSFTGAVDVPTPAAAGRAANKGYVDNNFQPKGINLTALAGPVMAADQIFYQTGYSSVANASLTPFARSLIAQPSAAAVQSLLGIPPSAFNGWSLGGNGYVSFNLGGNILKLQWGSGTLVQDQALTVTYPTPFSSFSRPVLSGGVVSTSAQENFPCVVSAGTASFVAWNTSNVTCPFWWLAVGV